MVYIALLSGMFLHLYVMCFQMAEKEVIATDKQSTVTGIKRDDCRIHIPGETHLRVIRVWTGGEWLIVDSLRFRVEGFPPLSVRWMKLENGVCVLLICVWIRVH